MDLKRLRYFCGIVEQGSISKAARVLSMAQPPLSKRLQELEEEVGVELLIRNGRGMVPTAAGLHLYKRASEVLRGMEDIKRETMAIGTSKKKVLRIGLSYLFNCYFRPLILALHKRHPDVELEISVSDTSVLESMLQNDRIDVALVQNPYRPEGYDAVSLPPVRTVVVISKALMPEVNTSTFALSEFDHLPLVVVRRIGGGGTHSTILEQLRTLGVVPKTVLHVSETGYVLDLLNNGLEGVALLPASEVDLARLPNCHVVDVYPSPVLFFPAVVKLTTAPAMPELMDIIKAGYPFPGSPSAGG
ncbi:LysR family transcriptional regulator [Microvirgula aerodenitrificans]|uniref:LysR family transcriptional regulator n=1 Tax=Microvirgula aerodenitrificans TaxID=57480 RepID=A0A2S0PFK8_9NEIS|nr:LysR family transcriptional regulator [Microvirgula aerodenitrificans]AVY96152.1 LysR family transcriptional regulator [Microvirgula aerodenitrificans]